MDWLKDNWKGVATFGSVFVLLIALGYAAGCSLGDVIKVRVPPNIAEVTGSPQLAPLNDAPSIRAKYVAFQAADLERFDEEVADKTFLFDLVSAGLNTGIGVGQGYLSTLPGGGIAAALLGGLGGLFISKPGEKKKLREQAKSEVQQAVAAEARVWQEKIDSYNKAKKGA